MMFSKYLLTLVGFLFLFPAFGQELELDSTGHLPEIPLAVENGQWKEFRSYLGGFRIAMPGTVEEKSYTLATDIGDLTYHTFFCQLPVKNSDNLIYMVSWVDYPEGSIDSDSLDLVQEFLNETRDAAAQSVKGDVVYHNPVRLQGYPGQLWRIDYLRGSAVIKTKAVVVDNRYYAIQTITSKDRNLNTSTDQFFDSFRIFVD